MTPLVTAPPSVVSPPAAAPTVLSDALLPDALLAAPWCALDDAALLARLCSDRGVVFEPVVDPEEVPAARIEGLMHGRFEFNGETHALPDPVDWLHNPSRDVEWHILLHKFYYAAGLAQGWQRTGDVAYVKRWVVLLEGWMAVTPPGFIAADVTGRRVQNWLASLHGFLFAPGPHGPAPLPAGFLRRLLHSLHGQVEHLCAHLTPKRNHRTLELLAILMAGVVLPEFRRAAHWREMALAETVANLQADLLSDGVHCELSTDYHHLAVRNWLQVRQLAARNGMAVPAAMDAALNRALDFALHVHQPGGGMPSFSDGDARSYLPLLAQAAEVFDRDDLRFVASQGRQGRPPAQRVAHFPAAGYHVLRSAWPGAAQPGQAQHLVFDCGPLGEGNHGHFDALSFELSAHGQALVVDPGRYTYSEAGATNWRVQFRGTAAHNTVCVDGQNQTRYLPKAIKEASRHAPGAVRHKISGPAPDTRLVEQAHGPVLDLLHGHCASHAYDAVHQRCIVFVDRRYWIVSDWLDAPQVHRYALRFQLSARAEGQVTRDDDDTCHRLRSPGLWLVQSRRAGQQAQLQAAWVSERYGHKQPAPAWVSETEACQTRFDTVLLPWGGEAPAGPLRLADGLALGPAGEQLPTLQMQVPLDDGVVHDGWFHHRGAGTGPWALGVLRFSGRWLHWRLSSDASSPGRVLRALSHPGARLWGPEGDIALQTVDGDAPT